MADIGNDGLGFIGAGRMATALARGVVSAGLIESHRIFAADPVPQAAEQFRSTSGGAVLDSNHQVAARCDVLVLAVKPQQIPEVLAEIKPDMASRHLVISIAAGVPLATLSTGLGTAPRLVRVMPNTPCLVGLGASGFCLGPGATRNDSQLIGRLLSTIGIAFEVPEKLLDAVTGLSGSGPAFVYTMIEALSDGGVRMGLPREVATALAAQTVKGAAEMVLATGQHPAVLREQVTSPGGTTIAGLESLEEHGVRAGLIAAVRSASERSAELGQGQ